MFALAVGSVPSVPGIASAEPTSADVESARALYVHGLELRDQGDLRGSLRQFRAAVSLAPTPITMFELGRSHSLVGELVDAREVLLAVERLPVRSDESPKAAAARSEAKDLAESLRGRIPSVILELGSPAGPKAVVRVDGRPIPLDTLGTPRRLDPGKHAVILEDGEDVVTEEFVLSEGETKSVRLVPKAPHATPRTTVPDAAVSVPGTPPSGPNRRITTPWFVASAITTGAGLVVGGVTGVLAFSKTGSVASECVGSHCPPSLAGDIGTAKTFGDVSTAAFVVAGVAGLTTLVLGVTTAGEPPRDATTSAFLPVSGLRRATDGASR